MASWQPIVYIAHSGERVPDVALYDSLPSLQADLVHRVDIAVEDQIILSRKGHSAVTAIKMKEDPLVLFVFNKKHVLVQTPAVTPLQDLSRAFRMPEEPIHPLSRSDARNSYEKFKWSIECVECALKTIKEQKRVAEIYVLHIRNKIDALLAAIQSLSHSFGHSQNILNELHRKVTALKRTCEDSLGDFENKLMELREVELHPYFQTSDNSSPKNNLLQYVDENRLKHLYTKCMQSCTQLETQLQRLTREMSDLEESHSEFPKEISLCETAGISQMNDILSMWEDKIKVLVSFKKELVRDLAQYHESKGNVEEESKRSDLSWSSKGKKILDEVEAVTKNIAAKVSVMSMYQKDISEKFAQVLGRISQSQQRLKDYDSSALLLHDSIKQFEVNFHPLKSILKMPSAYRQSLLEISRRNGFTKSFLLQVEQISEKLRLFRKAEIDARVHFMNEHGQFLPKNLVDLSCRPPICETVVRVYDPDWSMFPADSFALLEGESDELSRLKKENELLLHSLNESKRDNQILRQSLNESQELCVHLENKVSNLMEENGILCKDILKLKDHLEHKQDTILKLSANVCELLQKKNALTSECSTYKRLSESRVAFEKFATGDKVVFFPDLEPLVRTRPQRYHLSEASRQAALLQFDHSKRFIVGRIMKLSKSKDSDGNHVYMLEVDFSLGHLADSLTADLKEV